MTISTPGEFDYRKKVENLTRILEPYIIAKCAKFSPKYYKQVVEYVVNPLSEYYTDNEFTDIKNELLKKSNDKAALIHNHLIPKVRLNPTPSFDCIEGYKKALSEIYFLLNEKTINWKRLDDIQTAVDYFTEYLKMEKDSDNAILFMDIIDNRKEYIMSGYLPEEW